MRLEGEQHFAYAVRVEDEADPAAIAAAVQRSVTPMLSFAGCAREGEQTLLTLRSPGFITTAVEQLDGCYVVRGFEAAGRQTRLDYETAWTLHSRTDAAGTPVQGDIRPYEITELRFHAADA